MTRRKIRRVLWFGGLLLVIGIVVGLLGNTPIGAQSGPGYDLSWWTVDGGGITPNDSSGYTLGGTAGQPDAAGWSGGRLVRRINVAAR